MRRPLVDPKICKQRRDQLAKSMEPNSALIVPAHPEMVRNHDVHHPYRQSTDMFYLTGFEEPGSYFVFVPESDTPANLFVMDKDPTMEAWNGFRYGVEESKSAFQMDQTFSAKQFEDETVKLLKGVRTVYCANQHLHQVDEVMKPLFKRLLVSGGRSGEGGVTIKDSYALIGEQRLIKSEFEIETLRTACKIGSQAHIELMRATRPGINERALHGLFVKEIMQRGAAREGYGTIVASGDNANTLHYVFNDQEMKDGDLVLIDAGAEYNYYTSDITRTYPVNGEFTGAQRELYQGVLAVQKNLIESVKPGFLFQDMQRQTIEGLTDVMLELGILKGSRDEALDKKSWHKYYLHGVGHFLGSDVHDTGKRQIDGKDRPLEVGMCFTIEPGIYVPASDTDAPEKFRGIGIRIEDNILITKDGRENMTSKCPKEIDDMESIIGSNSDVWVSLED